MSKAHHVALAVAIGATTCPALTARRQSPTAARMDRSHRPVLPVVSARYRAKSYVLAKTLHDVPLLNIHTLIYVTLMFWLVGLDWST